MTTITFRLSKSMKNEIQELGNEFDLSDSVITRSCLYEGLNAFKSKKEEYPNGWAKLREDLLLSDAKGKV